MAFLDLTLFNAFVQKQNNGNAIDLDTADIRVSIHSNAYAPNQASHAFFSDVTNEVSGTNYTAGGTAISGVTLAFDGNVLEWIFNDLTWAQSGAGFSNGRHYLLREFNAAPASSKLIGFMTPGAVDFGNVAGPLTFDVSALTGALNITRTP
jgi:hypothetical protein